jgi:fumarylacetoacetase
MTWLDVDPAHPFGLATLPYGSFTTGGAARVGVAIGEHVLDLSALEGVDLPHRSALATPTLNAFMAAGPRAWSSVRRRLTQLLTDEAYRGRVEPRLVAMSDVTTHLPFEVGDYVDFYSSEHHATNVGRLFRPDSDPLTPNWKHLPIGYHGRAGSVVVSGTDVVRPCGQRKAAGDAAPTFGPSLRLDIEAEVGFVVGTPSRLGWPVPTADFAEHVFGVCLVNDWSARDLQAWEYVPLGPFLGKSFATSVSAWVTPLEALLPARVAGPAQDPPVLPYLARAADWALDLDLEVRLNGTVVARPPFAPMYWTPDQQLAHLTVNGASVRTGDLFASGTVSGEHPGTHGSLLELTWNGERPISLSDNEIRRFLDDGDVVTMTAWAPGPNGSRVGVGEVTGRVS